MLCDDGDFSIVSMADIYVKLKAPVDGFNDDLIHRQ